MSKEELIDKWEAFSRIQILEGEEKTEVLLNGKPYMRWITGDESTRRMAIVQLYEMGKGTQEEIAQAFHIHVNSVYHYVNAFKEGGTKGLLTQVSGPKEAWKITPEKKFKILEVAYRNRGLSYEEMGKELKRRWDEEVSINSIRNVLMENGFITEEIRRDDLKAEQGKLFGAGELKLIYNVSDNSRGDEERDVIRATKRVDDDGMNSDIRDKAKRDYSTTQRKYLDEIERSSSGYYLESGKYSAYAGGLLFVPLIMRHKLISMIKRVIKIDTQEGYSLGELSLALLYFDIFGFSSIENFKTAYPEEFGILIGKMSSPSIFTLRRFLHKVRELHKGEQLMEEFAKGYLRRGLVKWGVLYIDEHFLPYHGIQTITMGWYTVRNRPLKGGYNFISVDEDYNPFIFLIRPSSEDLIEKIPEIIHKGKKIAQEAGIDEKELIVIFDRGGYSAELFRILSDEKGESGARFISWAKYADKWVNDFKEEEFKGSITVKYKIQDSDEVRYFETERQMNKYGKIRAIVIMSGKKKKRTAIYTNDTGRTAEEIIGLICIRWGQENVNKALKINHCIDYFPGKGLYESEELGEQPMVENPEVQELKRERSMVVSKLHGLKVQIADTILSNEEVNWEDIQREKVSIMSDIVILQSQITLINHKIDTLQKEMPYDEAHNGVALCELDYEKKRFLDCIKIFAYHMQKQMCGMLLHYYDKRKEIWPAMEMIVKRGGNIKLEKGRLTVRLKSFKDPEIDYAARHLCDDLNQMGSVTLDKFHLPIWYEVA